MVEVCLEAELWQDARLICKSLRPCRPACLAHLVGEWRKPTCVVNVGLGDCALSPLLYKWAAQFEPHKARVPEPSQESVQRAAPSDHATALRRLWLQDNPRPDPALPAPLLEREMPLPDPPQELAQRQVRACFLVFVPETVPEVITIFIQEGMTVSSALQAVHSARAIEQQRRFSLLVSVSPQPCMQFATVLALPSWCRDAYVILDCTRCNGAMFSICINGPVTRQALLAYARAFEVYVPTRPAPLQEHEQVAFQTGHCVNFVPLATPAFVVTELQDMLRSTLGWTSEIEPPCLEGTWVYVLTDSDPVFISRHQSRSVSLRANIAALVGIDTLDFTLVTAKPRVVDAFDFGILAGSVFVATQAVRQDTAVWLHNAVYILDMRPILCGWSWGLADGRQIFIPDLVARFEQACPPGFYVSLSGGVTRHEDEGPYFDIEDGSVIIVDFKAHDIVSSGTESEESSSSQGPTDSESDSDDDDSGQSEPSAGPPPRQRRRRDADGLPAGPPPPQPCFHALGCVGIPQPGQLGAVRKGRLPSPGSRSGFGSSCSYHKWLTGNTHNAIADGSRRLTPIVLQIAPGHTFDLCARWDAATAPSGPSPFLPRPY